MPPRLRAGWNKPAHAGDQVMPANDTSPGKGHESDGASSPKQQLLATGTSAELELIAEKFFRETGQNRPLRDLYETVKRTRERLETIESALREELEED